MGLIDDTLEPLEPSEGTPSTSSNQPGIQPQPRNSPPGPERHGQANKLNEAAYRQLNPFRHPPRANNSSLSNLNASQSQAPEPVPKDPRHLKLERSSTGLESLHQSVPSNSAQALQALQQQNQNLQQQNQVLQQQLSDSQRHAQQLNHALSATSQKYAETEEDKNRLFQTYQLLQNETRQSEQNYQDKISSLESELSQIRREYAHFRTHHRLYDPHETSAIAREFQDINRAVEDAAADLSSNLLNAYPIGNNPDGSAKTTLHVADPGLLLKCTSQGDAQSSLARSAKGTGRDLQDYLDYAIRTILNDVLSVHILELFHPSIGPLFHSSTDQNHFLNGLYEVIRHREIQAVSGRWRSSAYLAIQSQQSEESYPFCATKICDYLIQERLTPLFRAIYGDARLAELRIQEEDGARLFDPIELALRWNAKIKSEVILLDYQVELLPNNAAYDKATMEPYERPKKGVQSKEIVCAGSLGLKSSEAIGGGKMPAEEWQVKVKVITPEYFSD